MLSKIDTKYSLSSFEWIRMEKGNWRNKTQEATRKQSNVGPTNIAFLRFLVT